VNIEDQLIDIRTRATISSLWVFFFINHFFMAIHEFANPEFMETLLAGEFAVGDTTLLIAAVALEPTIAMIVLSWVLPSRANWIANVSVAVFAIALEVASGLDSDLDNKFFIAAELTGLIAIIVISVKWRSRLRLTKPLEPTRVLGE
jgi:hypothetical protein